MEVGRTTFSLMLGLERLRVLLDFLDFVPVCDGVGQRIF